MTNDKQLGQEQRYVIDRLLRQGKSQKEIAPYWRAAQVLSQKTDFTLVSAKRVSQVEKMIHERPVRKFNYQTPNTESLQKFKVALIT
jgi:IS30 family transposase